MKNVIFQLLPSIGDGGAEILVKDYCKHIDTEKFKVVVVTIHQPMSHTACYRDIINSGTEIISIYKHEHSAGVIYRIWNKYLDPHYVALRLKSLIRQYAPVAIHAHLSVLRYLKLSVSSLENVRVYYTCHTEFDMNFNIPSELSAAKWLVAHKKIRLIALHNAMRKEINERLSVNNTIIINNAIDFKKFKSDASKEKIRKQLNIPSGAFVIGHVGRFNDVKNHTFLLDIFSEIRKRNKDAYLLMVGNGVNKPMIIEKIKKLGLGTCCQILSDRNDVNVLLRAMDIFVFPSLYEGLPVSLVEAQVSGLRCVVSDTITDECFFSEDMVPCNLSMGASKWADVILDPSIKGSCHYSIDNFDMNKEIKKLENLYLGIDAV